MFLFKKKENIMRFLNKIYLILVSIGTILLPITAGASIKQSVESRYTSSSTTVKQMARTKCIKWSKRCYTKKYCRREPHYYYCFYCHKYKGHGNYSVRKTCSIDSIREYHRRGYLCRYYGKKYGSCDIYETRKHCYLYCTKQIYY